RGRVLLSVVENLFPVTLRVHRRAGSTIDEDELRAEDEALALHVRANGHDAAATEAVEDFLVALDEPGRRSIREEHRAGHDERVLVFLADALPVRGVGEQPLVGLEIFLFFDVLQNWRRRTIGRGTG